MRSEQVLTSLADKAWVNDRIEQWRVEQGLGPPARWTRHFARIRDTEHHWAELVYKNVDDPTDLISLQFLHGSDDDIRFVQFPDDPALPGLAEVVGSLEAPDVIRYRPGHRCTVSGGSGTELRFVKVTRHAEALHRDAVLLWEAFQAGHLEVRVAEPLHFDAETQSFWQGRVAGDPVAEGVLGPDGETWAHAMGRSLGQLAGSGVRPTQAISTEDQVARTWRSADRTVSLFPSLAARVASVMDELERRGAELSAAAPVPVHGAPHMHQWLHDGETLGLVDFDRFAFGDPELDAATFLAELESEKSRQCPVDAVRVAMSRGYADAGWPLDQARVDYYLLHKRLSKVTRTAWAVRPDRAERTDDRLRRLERMLGR